MTPPRHVGATARGTTGVEGYLMAQAELYEARAEAESFAARMDWLTTAQREDVARHYVQTHLALRREALHTVAARCAELRQEYEARYTHLRGRLLRRHVAAALGSAVLCWAVYLMVACGLPWQAAH